MECGYINKMMMALLMVLILLCSGCENLKNTSETMEKCAVENQVIEYLKGKCISNCELLKCGDYKLITYKYVEEDADAEYWNTLIQNSSFNIDEDEIAQYSISIVENYQYIADLHGLELSDYCQNVLELDEERFYQKCFDEGCYDIEKILLVGHIAQLEKIEVTENDKKQFCKDNNLDYESLESDTDLYHFVAYSILEKK